MNLEQFQANVKDSLAKYNDIPTTDVNNSPDSVIEFLMEFEGWLSNDLEEAVDEIHDLRDQLKQANDEIDSLNDDESTYEEQVRDLQDEVDNLNANRCVCN